MTTHFDICHAILTNSARPAVLRTVFAVSAILTGVTRVSAGAGRSRFVRAQDKTKNQDREKRLNYSRVLELRHMHSPTEN
jgi:hypothetical protein